LSATSFFAKCAPSRRLPKGGWGYKRGYCAGSRTSISLFPF
jgi:hypothetical protein